MKAGEIVVERHRATARLQGAQGGTWCNWCGSWALESPVDHLNFHLHAGDIERAGGPDDDPNYRPVFGRRPPSMDPDDGEY